MSVDLPEPDAPMMRDELAALDGEVDAAQRVHLDVAQAIDLGGVAGSSMSGRAHRRPSRGGSAGARFAGGALEPPASAAVRLVDARPGRRALISPLARPRRRSPSPSPIASGRPRASVPSRSTHDDRAGLGLPSRPRRAPSAPGSAPAGVRRLRLGRRAPAARSGAPQRHAQHVVALVGDDARVRRHAGQQREVGVVDAHHHVVGDDVLHRDRRLADLRDLARRTCGRDRPRR